MKELTLINPAVNQQISRPLFQALIQAGFPSPADDYMERMLDLNEHLIQHPAATFFVRADGNSMKGAGIHRGDILIVDRSIESSNGRIVIAAVNGEFTVKRLRIHQNQIVLEAENPDYPSITISPNCDFQVWGVVTYIIHQAI
jgi:DNA polymerase V